MFLAKSYYGVSFNQIKWEVMDCKSGIHYNKYEIKQINRIIGFNRINNKKLYKLFIITRVVIFVQKRPCTKQ